MSEYGMERWRGAVALVTGASSGIGRAVARDLIEAGLRVALCARRKDRLETLAQELGEERALVVQADLRNEDAIRGVFTELRQTWGGVDVLVNNAGLGVKAPLMDGPAGGWREMLEVNVLALAICTQEALADFRAKGRGHVLHISSISGHRVAPGGGMYAATKHAVRALTEGLRQELREAGSPVRVTSISPGFVETEFAEVYHGSAEKARETYGRYRVLDAADVAQAVRYALSCPEHVQLHDVLLRPTEQAT